MILANTGSPHSLLADEHIGMPEVRLHDYPMAAGAEGGTDLLEGCLGVIQMVEHIHAVYEVERCAVGEVLHGDLMHGNASRHLTIGGVGSESRVGLQRMELEMRLQFRQAHKKGARAGTDLEHPADPGHLPQPPLEQLEPAVFMVSSTQPVVHIRTDAGVVPDRRDHRAPMADDKDLEGPEPADPLRVLLLTEFFPSTAAGEITGGVEARCYYVWLQLRDRDQIAILARRSDGRIWSSGTLRSIPARIGFLCRAFVAGLQAPADVVEATNQVVHPLGWLIARLRGIPLVYWYADVFLEDWTRHFGPAGLLGRAVEWLTLRLRADRYIAVSEATADKLRGAGVPTQRITVIPCGYEPRLVEEALAERQRPGEGLIAVNRLVRYKGTHLLLEAVAALKTRGQTETLTVIGQGPELSELRRLAESLGIEESVVFLGHVKSHSEVLRRIASAKALVSASTVEGFGITVVEAMALGVPYVVSDIPAYREVTAGGRGGRLFTAGSGAALVEQLADVLADDELRGQLAAEGRRSASRYRWEEISRSTDGVWREVLEPQ